MYSSMPKILMQTYRVLLVDDNQQFLALSQEFLGDHQDIEISGVAVSAKEALALLNCTDPHIMIVDLAMPGTNGLELTRQVKIQNPQLQVIVLTLLDSPRHRKAALEAGADAFVPKSAMDTDLVPTIRQLAEASN
jgi:DNA-binding NarL/FixJ family response regulator